MKTLGRDSRNDLYLSGTGLAVVSDKEAKCEIIEAIILTQQGEVQFDEEAGIDYFGTVFQNPNYIPLWAAQVRTKIEGLAWVSSIDDFTYDFRREESVLVWSMTVITTDDERLVLNERRTKVDGSPGIDVKWGDIYSKPIGIEEAAETVKNMSINATEREEFAESALAPSGTQKQVKDLINSLLFDPTDANYAATRKTTFTFRGVPLGMAIDFSMLKVESASKWYVAMSDGTNIAFDSTKTRIETSTDKFTHVITQRGDFSFSIRGDITKIEVDAPEYAPRTAYGKGDFFKTPGGEFRLCIQNIVESENSSYADIRAKTIAVDGRAVFHKTNGDVFPYLSSIEVGENVPLKYVGEHAFDGFRNLGNITWSSTAKVAFADYAFANCSSIKNLSWIPSGLSLVDGNAPIGEHCFENCSGLTSISGIPATAGLANVPDYCFSGCKLLASVAGLPETVTSIGEYSFSGCESLQNINGLANSITTIGTGAFKGCTGIQSLLYWPAKVVTVGNEAFCGCSLLRSLYIPATMTAIGASGFAECRCLFSVLSESDSVTIDETTFPTGAISLFVKPGLVNAYSGDNNWTTATGGNEIRKFGVMTFGLSSVASLTTLIDSGTIESESIWSVNYGDDTGDIRFELTATSIPLHSYPSGAEADREIVIKGYITEIASSSESFPFFATSDGTASPISSINIKDSPLRLIGAYCFADCPKLESIELWEAADRHGYHLGSHAFENCPKLTNLDWLVDGIGDLYTTEEVVVLDEEGNPTYDDNGNPITEIVETKVAAFGDYCFAGCIGLQRFGYSTSKIDSLPAYCFYGCTGLTSLDGIGSNFLTQIGEYCFANCTGLSSLHYTGTSNLFANTGITAIPNYCFYNCSGLSSLAGLPTVTESLGLHCFDGCSTLASIVALKDLPSLTTLPAYCFANCISLASLEGLDNIKDRAAVADSDDTDGIDTSEEAVVALGEHCFENCEGLLSLAYLCHNSGTIAESETSLNDNIRTIPAYCFAGCKAIESLVGLRFIETISEYAFSGCTGLVTTSGIGFNLSTIGAYAFQKCTGLQYVSIVAKTVPFAADTAFSGVSTSSIPLYVYNGMSASYTGSPWRSFGSVTSRTIQISLESYDPHTNVKLAKIVSSENGHSVFVEWGRDNDGYTDPTIIERDRSDGSWIGFPSGLVDISHTYENKAIRGLTITLYGDIESIAGTDEDNPFLNDTANAALAKLNISSRFFQNIGDYAFAGATGLYEVSLAMSQTGSDGLTIGNYAFYECTSIEEIGGASASPLKAIGNSAFYGCTSLYDVSRFFETVEIGQDCFRGCAAIGSLESFGALVTIGDGAFAGCSGLTTTEGLDSIETIGADAFSGCSGITIVSGLGGKLTTIGERAFAGCQNIRIVMMAVTPPPTTNGETLAYNVFDADIYDQAPLYVPVGWDSKPAGEAGYNNVEAWKSFETIRSRYIEFTLQNVVAGMSLRANQTSVTATGNWTIDYGDGEQTISYNSGTVTLEAYRFVSSGDKKVRLSGPITSISAVSSSAYPILSNMVGRNDYLVGIESSSAMEISSFGDYTFSGCGSLKSINDCESVKTIGSNCFSKCSSLTSLSGLSSVDTVGASAFEGCTGLVRLDGLDSVKTIGASAFRGCTNLKYIDGLGMNVESIGDNAFAICPLAEVQMFAPTPPMVSASAFSGLDLSAVPLYVLSSKVEAYGNADVWSGFATIGSRYFSLSMSAVPSGTAISQSPKGTLTRNTLFAVDWGDGGEIVGYPTGGVDYLPAHTYENAGNYEIKIEGAISGIGGVVERITAEAVSGDSVAGDSVADDSTADDETSIDKVTPFVCTGEGDPAIAGGKLGSRYLTAISLSSYLTDFTEIEDGAFYGCVSLASVAVPTVTVLGYKAFARCSALGSLSGFFGVVTIGDWCFSEDPLIVRVDGFGTSLEKIGDNCFTVTKEGGVKGSNIEYILMRKEAATDGEVPEITGTSFGVLTDTEKKAIPAYVPSASLSRYKNNLEWDKFDLGSQTVKFSLTAVPSEFRILGGIGRVTSNSDWTIDWGDGTTPNVITKNDVIIPTHVYPASDSPINYEVTISGDITSIGATSSTSCPILQSSANGGEFPYLTSVTCSAGVKIDTIGQYCFANCTSLTTVRGFSNATSIYPYAFSNCTSLKEVSGFDSLKKIEENAFEGCIKLNSVDFPVVTTIEDYAFNNCSRLATLAGFGSGLYSGLTDKEKVAITSTFGSYAFAGCDLRELTVNYIVPPRIFATTFSGLNTNTTNVFVPNYEADSDATKVVSNGTAYDTSVDAYKGTTYWKDFYKNIGVSSAITIGLNIGDIPSGVPFTLDFSHSSITFGGGSYTVDWGDGTTSGEEGTTNTSEANNTEDIPSHTYESTENLTGLVVIKGAVKSIGTDSVENPLFTIQIAPAYKDKVYFESFEVDAESKLETIGDYCFYGCDKLSRVTISNSSLTHIGNHAFDGCKKLSVFDAIYSSLTDIGNHAFDGCKKLSTFDAIWDNVRSIGDYAFTGCSSLRHLDLRKSGSDASDFTETSETGLTLIGEGAFSESGLVTFVCNGSGLATIPKAAFQNCTSLESFLAGVSPIATIGESAFNGCSGLSQDIEFNSELRLIETKAFKGSGITSLNWSGSEPVVVGGIERIGEEAFAECPQLTRVALPNTVESIGESAFKACTGLMFVDWKAKDEVVALDERAVVGQECFSSCSNLLRVVSFSDVRVLPKECFYQCSSLQSFPFSTGLVRTIGESCFYECSFHIADTSDVVDMELVEGLVSIGKYAFCGSQIDSLVVSKTVATIGSYAFSDNENLESVVFKAGRSSNASILSYAFAFCENLKTVEVEEGANLGTFSLYQYAFFGCQRLNSINSLLARATRQIGAYCFAKCPMLADVSLPAAVTELGEGCFNNSEWLDLKSDSACPNLAKALEKYAESDSGSISPSGIYLDTPAGTGLEKLRWAYRTAGATATVSSSLTDNNQASGIVKILFTPGSLGMPNGSYVRTLTVLSRSDGTGGVIGVTRRAVIFSRDASLNSQGTGLADMESAIAVSDPVEIAEPYTNYTFTFLDTAGLLRNKGNSSYYVSFVDADSLIFKPVGLRLSETEATSGFYFDLNGRHWEPKFSIGYGLGGAKTIGNGCFMNCVSLYGGTGSDIALNVSSAPMYAFYNCSSLADLSFLFDVSTVGKYAFSKSGTVDMPLFAASVSSLGEGMFKDCVNLESCAGLPGLPKLPERAFYNCRSLHEVANSTNPFPKRMDEIGKESFAHCTSLTKECLDAMSARLLTLNEGSFFGCSNILEFDGFSFVYNYPKNCFYGCTGLNVINKFSIPKANNVYECGYTSNTAFGGDTIVFQPYDVGVKAGWYIKSFTIELRTDHYATPGWYKLSIRTGETSRCKSSLTLVNRGDPKVVFVFPDQGRFANFENREYTIDILDENDSLTQLGFLVRDTFTTEVAVHPQGVKKCGLIYTIVSSTDNVPTLGAGSFGGNPSLNTIDLRSYSTKVNRIGSADPFSDIDNKGAITVLVQKDLLAEYKMDNYWNKFHLIWERDLLDEVKLLSLDLQVETNNTVVTGSGSIKFADVYGGMIDWGDGSPKEELDCDAERVFSLQGLTHTYTTRGRRVITIFGYSTAGVSIAGVGGNQPSAIFTLDNYISYFSSISVDRVTVIGEYAFYGYNGVAQVLNTSAVTEIGDSAFEGCLELESISIPEVITIGKRAFFGCATIEEFYLDRVQEIGKEAFAGCSKVHYLGMDIVESLGENALLGTGTEASWDELPTGFTLQIDISNQSFSTLSSLRNHWWGASKTTFFMLSNGNAAAWSDEDNAWIERNDI